MCSFTLLGRQNAKYVRSDTCYRFEMLVPKDSLSQFLLKECTAFRFCVQRKNIRSETKGDPQAMCILSYTQTVLHFKVPFREEFPSTLKRDKKDKCEKQENQTHFIRQSQDANQSTLPHPHLPSPHTFLPSLRAIVHVKKKVQRIISAMERI